MHLPHAPLVRRLLGAVELDVELTRAVVHHLHLVVRHKSSRCGGRGTRGRARAGRGARAHNSQQHARKAAAAWGAVWSATQAQRVARGTRQPHGERGEHEKIRGGHEGGFAGRAAALQPPASAAPKERKRSSRRSSTRAGKEATSGYANAATRARPRRVVHWWRLRSMHRAGWQQGAAERAAQAYRSPSVHKGPCACTQQRVLRAPPAPPAQLAKSGAG